MSGFLNASTAGGGGGGYPPGDGLNSIQFNAGPTTFGGDANLTWVGAKGLTDRKSLLVGSSGTIGSPVWAPGDPTNAFTYTDVLSNFQINDYASGDLSTHQFIEAITAYTTFKHTGTANASAYGMDFEPVISSDSTGPWNFMYGGYFAPLNYGSGNMNQIYGLYLDPWHAGAGTIGNIFGLYV